MKRSYPSQKSLADCEKVDDEVGGRQRRTTGEGGANVNWVCAVMGQMMAAAAGAAGVRVMRKGKDIVSAL